MKLYKKIIVCSSILAVLLSTGCVLHKKPLRKDDFGKSSFRKNPKEFIGLGFQGADIKFIMGGKKLDLSYPVYTEKNRYYIPLTEVADKLQGNISEGDGYIQVTLFGNEAKIFKNKNSYIYNEGKEQKLKNALIEKEGIYYLTFNDLSRIFNLVSRWNYKDKTITAYKNREKIEYEKYQKKIDTYGFIRLEDITVDTDSESSDYYESLRIISENLGSRKIPFSIAWIPKFVDPVNNIEADPSKNNNMNISELIYTLDYMESYGGIIGLHGYTHQRGREISGLGTEFGRANPDVGDLIERVKSAREISKEMGYDAAFFEVPHYEITKEQNEALEDYFKVIYHPYKDEKGKNINTEQVYRSPSGKSIYIATPLDYVQLDDDGSKITCRIKDLPQGVMASLFFHPRLEMRYIKLFNQPDGYPDYIEDKNSVLNRIIDALQERGYDMVDLRNL